MITNRNGYELLEYISCSEEELNNYENITGAGVIFEVDNKYLVGFNNWRLQWEIPAGGIEQGETPKQAALRELKEEAHQEIDDAEFVGLFKKKRPSGEIVHMAIYKYVTDSITPFIKQEDDENDEIKLWDLEENIGNVDEIDKEIIKTVKEKKKTK